MNEILLYFRDLPSGHFTLWAVLAFLLIVELAIHRNTTRKPPLV